MKNWLKSLSITAAIALVILPCVLFSACSNSSHPAKGDTYVFASFTWGDSVTDEMKELMELMGGEEAYKDAKIEFISETEVKMTTGGYTTTQQYVIKDGKVIIDEDTSLTIKGKTLVMTMEDDGTVFATVTYKLK